jgi:hypothetical protein
MSKNNTIIEDKDKDLEIKGSNQKIGVSSKKDDFPIIKPSDDIVEKLMSSFKETISKETNETKKDFMIIFGLFASFVTFISLNVQVINKTTDIYELVGVCLISISLIFIFAATIHHTTHDRKTFKDFFSAPIIVSIILLIIGFSTLYYGGFKNSVKLQDHEKANVKTIDSLSTELNKLKNFDLNLQTQFDTVNLKINQINDTIISLKKIK